MKILNKILTSINDALRVQIYGQTDIQGNPIEQTTLEGLPLGTNDQTTTGELGIKVILIGSRGGQSGQFNIPAYDYIAFTYYGSTNNIETQKFYTGGSAGTLVTTLTFAYAAAGVANDDLVTSITQS